MARTRATRAPVVRYGGRRWDTALNGALCAIKGCANIRAGYMLVVRSDAASVNGRVWYAPICTDCCKPLQCDPIPLWHIVYQQGGSAGTALALDVPIEVVQARMMMDAFERISP